LGPEGRRKLKLRQLSNDDLLKLYDSDLRLRLRNQKNLRDTRRILKSFKDSLGGCRPSPELAKVFLAQFTDRMPRTMYRYTQMLRIFMSWFGEPIKDVKIKIPKSIPSYTKDRDIDKLFKAIKNKKTHKKTIVRDTLLVELALKTGLRRGELANLEVKDIQSDFLIVRRGKNEKDRMIPLTIPVAHKLQKYIKSKKPSDKVFGLKAPTITMKIKYYATKAGTDLHAHSLRHKFATDLMERGVNLRTVQELLGHENLSTTQVYLSITDESLRKAVNTLEGSGINKITTTNPEVMKGETELTLSPMFTEPAAVFKPMTYEFFSIDISGSTIIVENIEICISEPGLEYKLMLFENNPEVLSINLEDEDLVKMKPVARNIFTYCLPFPGRYVNRDNEKKLHGGIGMYQRNIPIELLGKSREKERKNFMTEPVTFTITLRYRMETN